MSGDKAIIGKFYNDISLAKKEAEKKTKLGFAEFVVLQFQNGYMVVPKSLAEKL